MNALRSSVRPLVTFALAAALIAGFFTDRIPQEGFLPIAGAAVLYWFAQRGAGVVR